MEGLPIPVSAVLSKQTIKAMLAVVIGMMVVIFAILISILFQFTIVENLVMSWILTTAYAMFAFFLIDPVVKFNPIQVIEKPVYHEVVKVVEKPVYRDVQIPIENKTIEIIEKPIIQEVQVEVPVEIPVEKEVIRYIEREHKTLNIPQYNFIGSIQTRTFHKRTCKFSKMLKKKYKLHSNSKAFFQKKHYHACEACIKQQ